eukprot:2241750-Ditylum_brightwellii.AAC.1
MSIHLTWTNGIKALMSYPSHLDMYFLPKAVSRVRMKCTYVTIALESALEGLFWVGFWNSKTMEGNVLFQVLQ